MADMSYPIFVDLDATALEGGKIYVGTAYDDPETSPVNVYWDAALTILAAQPLLTSGGVIVRDGVPAQVYSGAYTYSLRVRDRAGALVWYKPIAGGSVAASRMTFPIPTGPASEVPGPANSTYADPATVTAQAAITNRSAIIADPSQGGTFAYKLGNFTDRIAKDPSYAVYVPAIGDPTGETGAWVRIGAVKLDVRWFGYVGDGVADDSDAIQRAIDYARQLGVAFNGGTIAFPFSRGKLTKPVNIYSRMTFEGVGGHVGTLIVGTHAGNLFQAAEASYVTFRGMAFTGSGCTAIRQTGSPTANYMENFTFAACHFHGDLAEGIYGDFIYPRITEDCTFGYYGNVGTSFRAIAIIGTGTNSANMILIEDSRFYNAKGGEAVRIENAIAVTLSGANFEQNKCCPLRLFGVLNLHVKDRSWFEMNSSTDCEIEVNTGSAIADTSACEVSHCHFTPAGSVVQFVKINASVSSLSFKYNTGDATGKILTNNPSKVIERIGNRLTNGGNINKDYVAQEQGDFGFADFSGAGLSLVLPTGSFIRNGNEVTVRMSFSYPTTSNTANAKIGGLPYVSTGVSVGSVLSNLEPATYTAPTISNPPTQAEVQGIANALQTQSTAPRSIHAATDGGMSTLSLFKPGTLTPLTNAQLSGKALYVTLTYIAPGLV